MTMEYYNSPPSSSLESLSIDEQITEIIPVISNSQKAPKLEAPDPRAAGYSSNIRTLVKNSGIYAVGSLASPLASLVLAPFLTHHLSRADYGTLAVLTTAIALLAGITQLGLYSAFFRSYNYDYESQKDRLGVISTVVLLLLLITTPTIIAAIIFAPWLTTLLLNSPSLSSSVRLAALVVFVQNLTIPGLAWLRAENRAVLFVILSIASLFTTLAVTFVLVGLLNMGIAGSLIATGSGYLIVAIFSLPSLLLYAGVRLRFDIAWGLLTFGLPNVSNFIALWVLQLSDRLLLSRLGSLTQTASYAVAYSLGGILSVVVLSPFTLAWPTAMFSIAKKDDAAKIFQVVFRWYSIVLLIATFGLSLISRIVLYIFFPLAYHSADFIIPIITLAIAFFGVYNMFTTGISIRRKTWFAVVFTTTSALVNVGLNLVLIPLYGSMGAALSTLFAYILLALIAYVVNQRIYPIPFEIGIFIIALFVGMVLYTGGDFLAQAQTKYVAWGIRISALVLYSGCLALLGMLPAWSHKIGHRQTQEGTRS